MHTSFTKAGSTVRCAGEAWPAAPYFAATAGATAVSTWTPAASGPSPKTPISPAASGCWTDAAYAPASAFLHRVPLSP